MQACSTQVSKRRLNTVFVGSTQCPSVLNMFIASVVTGAATDWASISPLLPSHSERLPVVPDRASAEQLFGGVNLGGGSPFAAFTIGSASTTSLTNSRLDVANLEIPCNSSTAAALVAGPRYVCTPDDTCGASSCVCRGLSAGSEPCMGVMNAGSVQLVSKPGSSGWAQLVSLPSWIQQTYPAVPAMAQAPSRCVSRWMAGIGRSSTGATVPERLADLQLLALHDWRVGLQESDSPNPNHTPHPLQTCPMTINFTPPKRRR